jgi:hypothetical protein
MAKVKVTHIKVPVEEYLSLLDRSSVASTTGFVRRMPDPCGRLSMDGYKCIHCGCDPEDVKTGCKFPRSAELTKLQEGKF